MVGHNGPPVCPVGTTAYREYYVLDPSDGLRLAASVRTNELPEADSSPHIYGTILHQDVDRDGASRGLGWTGTLLGRSPSGMSSPLGGRFNAV